jgi:hypothetical protein
MKEVIAPVIKSRFPEFVLKRLPIPDLTWSDNGLPLDAVIAAGAVIADITAVDADTLYMAIARDRSNKPIVSIVVIYEYEEPPPYILNLSHIRLEHTDRPYEVEERRRYLQVALERSLKNASHSTGTIHVKVTPDALVLAECIITVAESLESLRINSVIKHADELREIAAKVRTLNQDKNSSSMQTIALKAVKIVSSLFDALGTSTGAQVIISGAVAGILSRSGYSAATIYGFTLAAWQGKDAFMAYLDNFGSKTKPRIARRKPRNLPKK